MKKYVLAYSMNSGLTVFTPDDLRALTHINLAFGLIKDGLLDMGQLTNIGLCEKFREWNPDIKIVLSIGGWGAGGFSAMAMTEAGRKAFAQSCREAVEKYCLDGIDIDWEYPCSDQAGIDADPRDRENFTLLLKELRNAIGPRSLSIAAGAGKYFIEGTQMDKVAQLVDYVQIMTYDMRNGFTRQAGHHASLRSSKGDGSGLCTIDMVDMFHRAGVPMEKLVVGAAFYSRRWTGVKDINHGLLQPAGSAGEGGPRYSDITGEFIEKGGFTKYWDEDAGAAYLYNGSEFISYESPEAIALKCRYVKEAGLLGIMYWEHSCDSTHELLGVIAREFEMTEVPMLELDRRLTEIRPSARQFAFQQLEFYGFAHFTVNTYTGREWGDGTENPAIFNPTEFDAAQWVDALKAAGMRGLILTCKHHDGFCLWPSKYTGHTVAASPFMDGRGDIVRDVSEACREGGIKFGVYLSPWDRNQPCYGSGKEYDDYFVGQLTELLTNYGDIFAVWFDGACGEGPNGKRQVYDWERYYETVRRYQPGACMNVCGPDIRWCGNEAGSTRESEWSVVPRRARDTEKIAAESQQTDSEEFRQRAISASDMDLGSRDILRDETDLIWYPAEVNTSIRPGWFYHPEEDDKVKSTEVLFDTYLRSVGGNATFLLNIPPTPQGLFHQNDVQRLRELGGCIRNAFAVDLARDAVISGDDWHKTIVFPRETEVTYIVLQENILESQRIERFHISDGDGRMLYRGTTVGYKKIVRLTQPVRTAALHIHIDDSRLRPVLAFLGVY